MYISTAKRGLPQGAGAAKFRAVRRPSPLYRMPSIFGGICYWTGIDAEDTRRDLSIILIYIMHFAGSCAARGMSAVPSRWRFGEGWAR